MALALSSLFAMTACDSAPASTPVQREHVLRVVPQTDLEILDPVYSASVLTLTHAYLVYDTLFGMDTELKITPQMVDSYETSTDRKTWSFTLRDGLEFHDGAPVTAADVVASLKRWAEKNVAGQRLFGFVENCEAVDAKTFRMQLSKPYRLVLESLGWYGPPFIMPARVANISANTQIDDPTGSGPFIFKKDEWRPGEKVVYVRNPKYKPRHEAASGTAGGKIAKVDRIEWTVIKDPQTQSNALTAGEVDVLMTLPYEQYAALHSHPDVRIDALAVGQFSLIFNHLQPPFNDVKVRRAAMAAMEQTPFLKTQVGIPEMYRTCYSFYSCDSPYATEKGLGFMANPSLQTARQLLKESGYKGETIVVLRQTEPVILAKLPAVAAQLLRAAGFTVEVHSMDPGAFAARSNKKEGWNAILNGFRPATINPALSRALSAACYPKAPAGWPCDSWLEELRNSFGFADGEHERKAVAELIQMRAAEVASYVPLGEYRVGFATRKNVTGFVRAPYVMFWNVEKQ
jgi:peptide/nickel transport system substrate-binding protein